MLNILKPVLAAALLAPVAVEAAGYRDTSVRMQVVGALDLNRYLGKWYEIARYPNRFEKNCEGVTAEYSLRDDGKIRVLNTCREGAPDGPARTADGQATVAGTGKLKVTFVPWLPFAKGDYWVLHVEPDYSMAVVGEPKGRFGWILSRDKVLPPAEYDKALGVLQANGYDISGLERVAQ